MRQKDVVDGVVYAYSENRDMRNANPAVVIRSDVSYVYPRATYDRDLPLRETNSKHSTAKYGRGWTSPAIGFLSVYRGLYNPGAPVTNADLLQVAADLKAHLVNGGAFETFDMPAGVNSGVVPAVHFKMDWEEYLALTKARQDEAEEAARARRESFHKKQNDRESINGILAELGFNPAYGGSGSTLEIDTDTLLALVTRYKEPS